MLCDHWNHPLNVCACEEIPNQSNVQIPVPSPTFLTWTSLPFLSLSSRARKSSTAAVTSNLFPKWKYNLLIDSHIPIRLLGITSWSSLNAAVIPQFQWLESQEDRNRAKRLSEIYRIYCAPTNWPVLLEQSQADSKNLYRSLLDIILISLYRFILLSAGW